MAAQKLASPVSQVPSLKQQAEVLLGVSALGAPLVVSATKIESTKSRLLELLPERIMMRLNE